MRDEEYENYLRSAEFNGNIKAYKLTEYGEKYLLKNNRGLKPPSVGEIKETQNRRGSEKLNTPIATDHETLQAKLEDFKLKHTAYLAGAHKNEFKYKIFERGSLDWSKLNRYSEYSINQNFSKKRGWMGDKDRIYIEENTGKNGPSSIVIKFTARANEHDREDPKNLERKIENTAEQIKNILEGHGYVLSEPNRIGKPLFEIMNSPIAEAINGRYTEGEHGQRIDRSNRCTDDPDAPTEHQRNSIDTKDQMDWYEITDHDAQKGIEVAHRIQNIEHKINGIEKTSMDIAKTVATQVVENTIPAVAESVGKQVGKEVAKAFSGEVGKDPGGGYL